MGRRAGRRSCLGTAVLLREIWRWDIAGLGLRHSEECMGPRRADTAPGQQVSLPWEVSRLAKYDVEVILELEGDDLTEDMLDTLYEAGADDALLGRSNGVFFADFTREADSLLEAVISAIETIENAGVGARAVRVEPDDLVSIADIARRAGRTNESVRLLIRGDRGPGGFPAPTARVGSGRSRVWRWADVEDWFKRYEKHPEVSGAESYSAIISLVNDFLRLRTFMSRSDPTAVRVRGALEQRLGRGLAGTPLVSG
jgi:hypothetical protein